MISVIIPIYNAEKFLERCISSVLYQNFINFEIILVNDGSNDSSESICQKYIRYERVKYFTKENGGVSSARNVGIMEASGEYICFIDADDWVERDFLSNLMKNENEDLIISGYKSVFENKIIFNENFKIDKIINNNFFYPDDLLKPEGFILENRPFSKLFKLSLIHEHQIRFKEQLQNGEDFIFNLQYGLKCKSILFQKSFDYCYNKVNEDSATTKYSPTHYHKLKATKDAFFDIISEYRDVPEEEKLYQYFRVASKAIFEEGKLRNTFIIKYKQIKSILSKEEISLFIKNYPRKKSRESKFFDFLQLLMKLNQPFLITLLVEIYYKRKNA